MEKNENIYNQIIDPVCIRYSMNIILLKNKPLTFSNLIEEYINQKAIYYAELITLADIEISEKKLLIRKINQCMLDGYYPQEFIEHLEQLRIKRKET